MAPASPLDMKGKRTTTIAIVGGRLQGTDGRISGGPGRFSKPADRRRPSAPARKICDRFLSLDVIKYTRQFLDAIAEADLVLPALENREVLAHLTSLAEIHGFPLGFDLQAYDVTASKRISDRKMAAAGIPVPGYYPDATFPLIAKPSQMSGSVGVKRLANQCDLLNILPRISTEDWVLQEYLSGPSYSPSRSSEELEHTKHIISRNFSWIPLMIASVFCPHRPCRRRPKPNFRILPSNWGIWYN